jgi:hypothetical protein
MNRKALWIAGTIFFVVLAFLLGSQSATDSASPFDQGSNKERPAYPTKHPIGLRYEQVLAYLDNFFVMEKTDPVRGYERRMGQSKVSLLEVMGDKDDIVSATLIIGLPNDSPKHLIENSAMMLRFLMNTFPEWEGASDWALKTIQNREDDQITRGDKRLRIGILEEMGMISIAVEHKANGSD